MSEAVMMPLRNTILLLPLAAVACAQTPESVQPAYVSEVPYETFNCQQLGDEQLRLASALAAASKVQSNTRSNDTVGVIFLGLPLASMSGGNVAPEIARYKGETVAVQQASSRKNCVPSSKPTLPPS